MKRFKFLRSKGVPVRGQKPLRATQTQPDNFAPPDFAEEKISRKKATIPKKLKSWFRNFVQNADPVSLRRSYRNGQILTPPTAKGTVFAIVFAIIVLGVIFGCFACEHEYKQGATQTQTATNAQKGKNE